MSQSIDRRSHPVAAARKTARAALFLTILIAHFASRCWCQDIPAPAPLATLDGHQGTVDSVIVSPDGNWLATHGGDGTRLWNLATRKFVHRFDEPAVFFSADSSQLITRGDDAYHVCGIPGGDAQATLGFVPGKTGRNQEVVSDGAALSPDGKTVAGNLCIITKGFQSMSFEFGLVAWDGIAASQALPHGLYKSGEFAVNPPCFSPDGKRLAAIRTVERLRDVDSDFLKITVLILDPISGELKGEYKAGTERARLDGKVVSFPLQLSYSPDGKRLLAGQGADLTVWEVAKLKPKDPATIDGPVRVASFTPDSANLIEVIVAAGDAADTIKVWSLSGAAPKKAATWAPDCGQIWSICVTNDGKTMITGGDDGVVRLWKANFASRVPARAELPDVTAIPTSPAIAPSNKHKEPEPRNEAVDPTSREDLMSRLRLVADQIETTQHDISQLDKEAADAAREKRLTSAADFRARARRGRELLVHFQEQKRDLGAALRKLPVQTDR